MKVGCLSLRGLQHSLLGFLFGLHFILQYWGLSLRSYTCPARAEPLSLSLALGYQFWRQMLSPAELFACHKFLNTLFEQYIEFYCTLGTTIDG